MAQTKTNPFAKMSEDRKNKQAELEEQAKAITPQKKAEKPKAKVVVNVPTRGKGRPCIDESKGKKRDYCKTINIAVPKDKLDQVNEYALNGRGLNLTEYINTLIEQDLERNIDKYKKEIKRTVNFD